MAKPVKRGLPDDFSLDLPEDTPVLIGDFLDEPPVVHQPRRSSVVQSPVPEFEQVFRPEIVPPRERPERAAPVPVRRQAQQPKVIRYQLNLSPRSKTMLEEFVEHVQTYGPQADARTSEVFQGIMTVLHTAMDELELSDLPLRGAWGSVTAKNFPVALSEAFEKAIVRSARRRGVTG